MIILETLPQKWVDFYEKLPDNWLQENAPYLLSKEPQIEKYITDVAKNVFISEKLLVTRMELEQSAISYKWDGTTSHYGGGEEGDELKLYYLCGVDKTDSGPRENGWFGPKRQLLGCALRFKYWYRGIHPNSEGWENWLGLDEDNKFQSWKTIVIDGENVKPINQISADCLRYTPHLNAQFQLRNIAMKFFPDDFIKEIEKKPIPIDNIISENDNININVEEQLPDEILEYPKEVPVLTPVSDEIIKSGCFSFLNPFV